MASEAALGGTGDGGGAGSDRVGRLEADVSFIKATLPFFATKEDLEKLRHEVVKGDSDLRVEMEKLRGHFDRSFMGLIIAIFALVFKDQLLALLHLAR
jgi:hypothetical protein